MDRIPDEVLILILEKLPAYDVSQNAALVCKRWYRLIKFRCLHVNHEDHLENIHVGLVAIFATRVLPSLTCPTALISKVAMLAPRLQELTMHDALLLDAHDLNVLTSLKYLRHLDVFIGSSAMFSKSSRLPPQITSLVLNNAVTRYSIRNLQRQNKLTSLHMYGASHYYPIKQMMTIISVQRMHLTDLTLRCHELSNNGYAIIGQCRNLRHLRLYSCWLLTSNGVQALCELRLRTLHLTGTCLVRPQAFATLIKTLPLDIEELNLSASYFIDCNCAALAMRLPALQSLELWRCGVMSTAGIVKLASMLKSLQYLDTDLLFNRQQIKEMAKHKSLKRLRCRFNCKVTDVKLDIWPHDKHVHSRQRNEGEGPSSERYYFWGPARV